MTPPFVVCSIIVENRDWRDYTELAQAAMGLGF
jgi:hypothetical protein